MCPSGEVPVLRLKASIGLCASGLNSSGYKRCGSTLVGLLREIGEVPVLYLKANSGLAVSARFGENSSGYTRCGSTLVGLLREIGEVPVLRLKANSGLIGVRARVGLRLIGEVPV